MPMQATRTHMQAHTHTAPTTEDGPQAQVQERCVVDALAPPPRARSHAHPSADNNDGKPKQTGPREGDWECKNCGLNNFANRSCSFMPTSLLLHAHRCSLFAVLLLFRKEMLATRCTLLTPCTPQGTLLQMQGTRKAQVRAAFYSAFFSARVSCFCYCCCC
jgi:hypothetical protein